MPTFGDLFNFNMPQATQIERPQVGQSSIQTALNDVNQLGTSINQGLTTTNSIQDQFKRLGRYSERDALMAELQGVIGDKTNAFEEKTITGWDGKPTTIQVPSDALNSNLRNLSMKVLAYASKNNDFEFAKLVDGIIGDFIQKGGLTANKALDEQNRQQAISTGNQIAKLIGDMEKDYLKDKTIDDKKLTQLRSLMSQYESLSKPKRSYPGNMPAFLADKVSYQDKQTAQETGYRVEAINTANQAINQFVQNKQEFIKKLRNVVNTVKMLSKAGTGDARSDLFTIVKFLSSIIEPGMAVTEGEVEGYMGSTDISKLVSSAGNVSSFLTGVFGSETPSIQTIKARTANIDPLAFKEMLNKAKALGKIAIKNWSDAVINGNTNYAKALIQEIDAKYNKALDNETRTSLKENIDNKLNSMLGVSDIVTGLKTKAFDVPDEPVQDKLIVNDVVETPKPQPQNKPKTQTRPPIKNPAKKKQQVTTETKEQRMARLLKQYGGKK